MTEKKITLHVLRCDPGNGKPPSFEAFDVPWLEDLTVMGALDYIFENVDPTLAYYDHAACAQGICKTCMVKINGQPGLMCQTHLSEDVTLEPLDGFEIVRDLVTKRRNHG